MMRSVIFDTLRFSRGLREVGVPEQQADRQAELMAEAFSAFADKLVTKDYFSEVLGARLNEQTALLEQRMAERFAAQDAKFEASFAGQDTKFEARFAQQEAKFEARFAVIDSRFSEQDARFAKLDRTLLLHTWMLGLITLVLVVPQLQAWLA